MKIDPKNYPYLYETHMHTGEGSQCGQIPGAQMADAYKAAGYDGIIITDHHYGGNTRPDRSLPWEEWCEQFFAGYRNAKARGDEIGLKVFCGWESGFHGTEFLVYGLNEEWMKRHPELKTASIEEQYRIVHEGGGIVIHAHPFRQRTYIPEIRLFPEYVDGVEGINAKHPHTALSGGYGVDDKSEDDLANPRAFEYANKHNLPTTAGSDMHDLGLYGSGMMFERPLDSIEDFIGAILSHGKTNDYILYDGINYYTKTGELIEV